MDFVETIAKGLFRFVFDSNHPNLEKYLSHPVREQMRKNGLLHNFDKSSKSGDTDLRDWWVSNERLPIDGVQIEKWVDGAWVSYDLPKTENIKLAA